MSYNFAVYPLIKNFLQEVLTAYLKRFCDFGLILYGATILSELLRQVMLEQLQALQFRPEEFSYFHPFIILPAIGVFLTSLWGFASLYYSFSGLSVGAAVFSGLKNLFRYAIFVITASVITLFGFSVLTIPVALILKVFLIVPPTLGIDKIGWITTLPAFLILVLPGLFLMVAFSIAPLFLLLEKRGVFGSLWESYKRTRRVWWKTVALLGTSLIIAAAAYLGLMKLVFVLKLYFIADLSFRGESMLRVFLYSTPWVIAASFYDLALYRLYLRLRVLPQHGVEVKPSNVIYPEKLEPSS